MPFSLCYLFRESGPAPSQVCSALGVLGIQRGLRLAILHHTLLWRGWQSSAILLLWMASLEIVSSLGLSRTTLYCLVLCMAMTSSSPLVFFFLHLSHSKRLLDVLLSWCPFCLVMSFPLWVVFRSQDLRIKVALVSPGQWSIRSDPQSLKSQNLTSQEARWPGHPRAV